MTKSASILDLARQASSGVDRWLMASEVNAAGRLGLFRILYGLFLLWTGSQGYFVLMAQAPVTAWDPIFILHINPSRIPTPAVFRGLEFILIFAIVLLIIGYRVRLTTIVVFVFGFVIEAFRLSYGRVEHGSVFQSFYIPLVMILSQWGATYSLDAVLRQRRTGVRVSPNDSSWRYAWPIRFLLLILSILYLTAAYWKWAGSPWVTNPDVFANFLLRENIDVTTKGAIASPLLPLLAQIPVIMTGLRFTTLFFELLFFTSLFSHKLRNLFVSTAIIFHAINALLAQVSFTYLLIVYGLFVDWQRVYERWCPAAIKRIRLDRWSSRALIAGSLAFALIFALLWSLTPYFRLIFNLGGLIDWRTIWYILLPFGIAGFVRAVWVLFLAVWRSRGGAVSPRRAG